MSYPPLNMNSTECRKCGTLARHYVEYECISAARMAGEAHVAEEWMLRTCRTCQYTWREAVLAGGSPGM